MIYCRKIVHVSANPYPLTHTWSRPNRAGTWRTASPTSSQPPARATRRVVWAPPPPLMRCAGRRDLAADRASRSSDGPAVTSERGRLSSVLYPVTSPAAHRLPNRPASSVLAACGQPWGLPAASSAGPTRRKGLEDRRSGGCWNARGKHTVAGSGRGPGFRGTRVGQAARARAEAERGIAVHHSLGCLTPPAVASR